MVGFEPTKHIAHDLKSGPVDRLGKTAFIFVMDYYPFVIDILYYVNY